MIKHFGGLQGASTTCLRNVDGYKKSNVVVPFWSKNSHKIIETWSCFLAEVASDEAKSIACTFAAFQTKLKSADTYPLSLLYLKGYFKIFRQETASIFKKFQF